VSRAVATEYEYEYEYEEEEEDEQECEEHEWLEAEFILDLGVKGVQRSLCYTPQSLSASLASGLWGSRWQ
jgi:hypothetical protein